MRRALGMGAPVENFIAGPFSNHARDPVAAAANGKVSLSLRLADGLRTLLLHVGCGWSLRETAVQAKLAGIADVSDVTLLNR